MKKTGCPRAILFDWDDTLVENWSAIQAALAETFRAMGQDPPASLAFNRHRLLSLRDSFPKIFGADWMIARDSFYKSFAAEHLRHLRIFEGVEGMLSRNFSARLPMAVVSNKTGSLLRKEARHLRWEGYFHRLVGAGDAERDKPDPRPVELALSGMEVCPSDTWFVGDSLIDVECASKSGCRAIFITAKRTPSDDDMFLLAEYDPVMVEDIPHFVRLLAGSGAI